MKNKKPNTFFICCCDNRIMPYDVSSKKPGDLFILRNIGNLIPPYQSSESSVVSAIKFAVEIFSIPEIIVCGHSDCGGMKAALAPASGLSLKSWLKYAVSPENVTSPDELSKANVLQQIINLKTYPAVAEKLSEDNLTIQAWWLDLNDNVVYVYNDEDGHWKKK